MSTGAPGFCQSPVALASDLTLEACRLMDNGDVIMAMQNARSAIQLYSQQLQQHPDDVSSLVNRAHLRYVFIGRIDRSAFQAAVDDCTRAIALAPGDPDAYVLRGYVLCDQSKYKRSIQDFDQAILRDPQNASAYHGRAITYAALGRSDKAVIDFTRAIALAKTSNDAADSYHERAVAYSKLGKAKLAESDRKQSCKRGYVETAKQ